MHSHAVSVLLALTTFTIPFANGFKLTAYNGEQCRSARLNDWTGGPNEGCQDPINYGVAQSVVISSTGPVDDNFYTVFFSSDDCDPDTEVNNGQGHFDDGCFTGEYKSFAVWDVTNLD